MELKNDLLLRAAKGETVERTPVWVMRQAGRILPEYRAVRAKLSGFKELVETPELACEVTLQPVDLLGVDAAIIFSDILVIPEAMGLEYQMIKGKGPIFEETIRSEADLSKIHVSHPDELSYVTDAIRLTKRELNGRVPLIGFAGAPWTIFAYMVEGSGSKTFSEARKVLYQQPELAHKVLGMITDSTITYLQAQVNAGADLIQLFDSWAGILPHEQYEEFSAPYIRKIVEHIQDVPTTVFAKGAYRALPLFAGMPCNTIGLDWNMDVENAKKAVGTRKTLQGNLDPCLLYADTKTIEAETKKMLQKFGDHRHIANLGHGVYPDTNPDHVKCFIETIQSFEK
jgi:uroporphyrinogen decarboxylase